MTRLRKDHITPTVATHFPSLSQGPDIHPTVHMFTQDVQLAIMPIGGRTEKHNGFTVTLEGNQGECTKAESLIREFARHNRYDITGVVCDAVTEITRRLTWEGCAVYEIVHSDEAVPRMFGFTSEGLWKIPRHFLQIIPRGDWDYWKRKVIAVPESKIWYLEMPPKLGGRGAYKKILKQLRKFDNLGPKFWKHDLKSGIQSKNFDSQRYTRNSEIYYNQVTKSWGWNRRDWSLEKSTEFFSFYKMVNFRLAQTILREHIISELNRLLARLETLCEIRVSGLPTASDILQTRSELLAGEISFSDASDRVKM